MSILHNTDAVARRMSEITPFGKPAAETAIKALVAIITDAAISREDVKIQRLGTFKVKETKARKGRNPKTGEVIDIPARVKLTFIPAKALRDI